MGKIIGVIAAMRGQRVYVDTNIFIYFLERNADFFPLAAPIIQAISANELIGLTGEITVAEALIQPYRAQDTVLIAETRDFFEASNFLTVLSHDKAMWELAAQLRAAQRLKLPDAVHLATALKAACRAHSLVIGNKEPTGALSVVQLGSLL